MGKKIGVMGCGVVAGYGHLPAICAAQGLELHALYDPHAEALAAMAKRYDAPHASTDEAAFFASGLDGVLICSPAPAHEANVLAAVKHGLPILCEKPLSMDKAQGQRMIDAAEAAGVPLYVAFCYRFSPVALQIKQLVAEGAIGQVRSLRLIYNWNCHGKYLNGDPAQGLNPYRDGRMIEGGPMVDCGTHQIDLAQWWLDSPVVRSVGHGAWADAYEAPDHVWAHLDHDNGAHTVVEISYGFTHTAKQPESTFKYELIGDDGVILYDRNTSRFELRNTQGTRALPYHEEKGFHEMYHAFEQALRTATDGDLPTAQEGLRVTDIAVDVTQQAVAARLASK